METLIQKDYTGAFMNKRARKPEELEKLHRYILIGVPVLTFLGGMAFNAFTIAKNIASVDLVQERYNQSLKYTDGKFEEAIRQAEEHSDKNRLAMEKQMEQQTSLIREQGAYLKSLEGWMQRMSDVLSRKNPGTRP